MAEERLNILDLYHQELFESIPLGIVFQDADGIITAANPAAQQILGLSLEQMLGLKSIDSGWQSTHEDGTAFPGSEHPTMLALKTGKAFTDVVMVLTNQKTEQQSWIVIMATPIFEADQQTVKAVYAVFKDITKQKKAEIALKKANLRLEQLARKMKHLAQTDALTGLANRHAFNRTMAQEFQRFARFHVSVAVLMVDIDHFKQVNDQFGHEAGDNALKTLASVLKNTVRVTDIAARYGGEEFVLVFTGADVATGVAKAESIRQRLGDLNIRTAESQFQISVSIGVAVIEAEDLQWGQVLQRADQALYRAKFLGRNRVVVADATLVDRGI